MASSDREEIDKLLAPLSRVDSPKNLQEKPRTVDAKGLTKRRDDDGQGKPSPLSDYHLERINQQDSPTEEA